MIGNTFSGRESLGEIARRFGKTAMGLTAPQLGDGALFHVECSRIVGHVLMLVPISDAERALIDESGLEAFESRPRGATSPTSSAPASHSRAFVSDPSPDLRATA